MIRAIAENGNLAVIALSREDVERLIAGGNVLVHPKALPGLRQFILLAGGETEADLLKKLDGLAKPAPGRPK